MLLDSKPIATHLQNNRAAVSWTIIDVLPAAQHPQISRLQAQLCAADKNVYLDIPS
jgi:hypothetical protein